MVIRKIAVCIDIDEGNNVKENENCLFPDKEVLTMMERQIKLNAAEDVSEFVNAASKCDFDIDVFCNRIVIDAKSVIGVFSMDINKIWTVKCYGEDPRFNKTIAKFAVA